MPAPTGFRIGRLGSLAGVAPTTLRAWERRYGLFHPSRTAGGFRIYSEADLATARAMAELTSRGLSAGEAAAQLLAPPVVATSVSPGSSADDLSFEALVHRLHQSVVRMDEPGMQSLLDEIFGSYTVETAVERILLPELARIGHEWSLGKMTIAQEHLASNIFRGRLAAHARGWGHGVGPAVVLACPPGEQHDLPLIAFGLALRSFGWRIIFLGTDTPVEEVKQVVERVEPRMTVLASPDEERFLAVNNVLRGLPRETTFIAGAGATQHASSSTGLATLTGTPFGAARELSAHQPKA